MALGRKYTAAEGGNGTDFHPLFKELIRVIGEPSIGDSILLLGWIDKLSGLESRVEIVRKKFNDFSEVVIQEHQVRRNNQQNFDKEDNIKDLVDVLLDVQKENPKKISRDDIKGLILVSDRIHLPL
uniref:Uncharacterized protein n=1 Tax=Chenopodium quinoa TaxID=63459 RepID=A0A803MH03_CHEQI